MTSFFYSFKKENFRLCVSYNLSKLCAQFVPTWFTRTSVMSFGVSCDPARSFQIGSARFRLNGDPVRIAMPIRIPKNLEKYVKCQSYQKSVVNPIDDISL